MTKTVLITGCASGIGALAARLFADRGWNVVATARRRDAVPAFMSAYYATKFAVEGLSESLRFELQPHGVRVKLIEPGHFKTDFVERSLQWAPHGAYEPQASNMKAWVIHSDHTAPSAEPVARAIFTAATDRSDRLRYPVKSRLMLAAHALLPDAAWRSVIAAGMTRRPKARSENKAIR